MEEIKFDDKLRENIFKIFKDFMARITMLEELETQGSKLLSGLQQGIELLRRPAVDRTSKLIENVIQANNTKNVRSYIEGGCINTHDGVRSARKSRSLLDELKCLLEDANSAMQAAILSTASAVLDEDVEFNEEMTNLDKKSEINEYALLMGIINFMVKRDYEMQEKIISGLNLKSSSGELESYCLMWSLRPFIDEEIMAQAWKLIP